jgi:N-acetylmuramoyl-L-alanine amidase
MTVLNPEWLSPCSMERIVCHWTAGTYDISDNDASHYHVILDRYGVAHRGDNPISGNARENPVGPVTSHVKNMNTGSIGIAMAAMGDAIESPFDPGPWPITRIQFLRFAQACAELCTFYEIPITDTTLLQHGEVQENCGVAQSGKWDVGRLPFAPDKFTSCADVGDHLRWLVSEIMEGGFSVPSPLRPPQQEVIITISAPPGVKITVRQEEDA